LLVGEALDGIKARVIGFGNAVLEAFNSIPKPIRDTAVRFVFLASAALSIVGAATAVRNGITIASAAMRAFGVTAGGSVLALGPATLAIGALTVAFFAFRHAYEANLGGFRGFVDGTFGQVRLAFSALGQLFSDGGFSGDVAAEFQKGGNPALNFAIQIYVLAGRIKGFLMGLGEGFSVMLEAGKDAFKELGQNLGGLADAFGVSSVNTKGNKRAFDDWRNAGAAVGKVAAKLVTSFVELVNGVTSVVRSLGGLDTILTTIKVAMAIIAAQRVAAMVSGFASVGASAVASLGRVVSSLATVDSKVQSTASNASKLNGIGRGLTKQIGAADALSGAILGIGLAIDQASKLSDELGKSGWDEMTNKLRYDLGIDSKEEYEKKQGIRSGYDADRRAREATGGAINVATDATRQLRVSPDAPAASPAVAALPRDNGEAAVAAVATAVSRVKIPAPRTHVNVYVDNEQIPSRHDQEFVPGGVAD
jgi:hypothetical protein